MSEHEPIVVQSGHLDVIEDVLDALAEGYGINAPDEDEQAEYVTMLEDLRDARP